MTAIKLSMVSIRNVLLSKISASRFLCNQRSQFSVEGLTAYRYGNTHGRSTRIWLDSILKKELNLVVDWSLVDKDDYLLAMERSPIKDIEIKHILRQALTDKIEDREIYMKGIDHSYYYEGYTAYRTEEL